MIERGRCRVCGCTESDACRGGCAWWDDEETLCSRCARGPICRIARRGAPDRSPVRRYAVMVSRKAAHILEGNGARFVCGRRNVRGLVWSVMRASDAFAATLIAPSICASCERMKDADTMRTRVEVP